MMIMAVNCHLTVSQDTMVLLETMEVNATIDAHAMNHKDRFTVHLVLGTMDVNVDTVLHQTTQCLHTTAVLQYVVQTVTMMKYVATTDLTVMDARWVIVV